MTHDILKRRLEKIEARIAPQAPDTRAMVCAFLAWIKERPDVYDELRTLIFADTDLCLAAERRGLSREEAEHAPEVRAARERWMQRALQLMRQAGMHKYADLWEREMEAKAGDRQ